MATDYTELNIDDTLRFWSNNIFDAANDTGLDRNNFNFVLDYSRVRFAELEPTYDGINQGTPCSEVIHEATLRNGTDRDQSMSLRTAKSSTSTARFDLTSAIVADGKTKLNLNKLPECIPRTSGFSNELSLKNVRQHEFKEKLEWQIDNSVIVGKGSAVKADVVVNEKSYEAKFSVKTEIFGNVHMDVLNPNKNNNFEQSEDGDIVTILREFTRENEIPGLTFHKNKAVFVSKGVCKFRYGISYNVNLSKSK